ncbi:TlpA disulfide reductase family protein [Pedobacter sp.]|jgi:thiol-disulfide isomerase/thioredoxin|uniref:TlpA family protein disulfide reductase n=1 Tax=Pedobacter sp. TaxID=1411316 RepID=UPI002BECB65B|nr:TlpA disulfide reductase family protein [Pedobacter sp.]HWW42102.1 TlpA disulfide reductase family protein [Pedobacter sp.]
MIKKLFGAALIVGMTSSAFAQLPVEITGLLKKQRLAPVKLFKVEEGKPVEISTSTPGSKGNFGFIFYPEYEGLYVIGTGTVGSPNDNYKFYFKGGEKLSLSILDSSYVLNGKLNSKENVVLTQWHDFVNPLEQKAINFMKNQSTFVDFFPKLEEISAKTKGFLAGKATGNAKFDRNMKQYMAWDMASYATNFLNTPRSAHPSVEEYSPYYSTLKAKDFAGSAASVYSNPWGIRTLSGLISVNMRQENIKYSRGIEGVKNNLVFLPNDTLKGDFILDHAAGYKNYSDYKELIDTYGKYVITPSQKKRNLEILAPLAQLKPGDAAFAFSYPDKDGKTVKMSDLKGKVVLVDVWATWCGPCKAEIPHLKKLEEEMKGTDVQVVSISVDEAKDKDKWLKMIKDDQLGGLQLFATGWSDIAKYYKINGIPRFMVFDKEGKIVTIDSPRPSDPALKVLLEKTLAGK